MSRVERQLRYVQYCTVRALKVRPCRRTGTINIQTAAGQTLADVCRTVVISGNPPVPRHSPLGQRGTQVAAEHQSPNTVKHQPNHVCQPNKMDGTTTKSDIVRDAL
ncbi:hypothetical protein J6590_004825 [Homalodisca vitripennis]|nr:hypothetical protein J6590_004825 [Homalodisca vitripennis]